MHPQWSQVKINVYSLKSNSMCLLGGLYSTDYDVSCCYTLQHRRVSSSSDTGRLECEDYVKAIRHDRACAMLGFAERWGLCGSQIQRVNDFNNQKTTIYQLNIFPGVSHPIYKTGAKEIPLTKRKDSFKPSVT